MSREESDARTSGKIYLEVVKSFLLYGSDTWFLTPRMKMFWGGFCHRVVRKLIERKPRKGQDRG